MNKEIKCRCGGLLIKSICKVEFFRIDFGLKSCDVCNKCHTEYLHDNTMEEIEKEVKNLGFFGVDKK